MKQFEKLTPVTPLPQLKQRKNSLLKAITTIKKELAAAPEGKLRISKNRNLPQFYHVTEKSGTGGKYLSKKEEQLIQSLAQKEYLIKEITSLQKELSMLEKLISLYEKESAVYQNLSEQRQLLVKPVTLSDQEYAKAWSEQNFVHKQISRDVPQLFTARGEQVRSKSELIIADTLFRLGIPYRYEFPLKLPNFTVHPDFYCLNLRTRQEFVWEHFGMMDDREYAQNATDKIASYHMAGYIEGKNFITTMETSRFVINSKVVEQLAREWLM